MHGAPRKTCLQLLMNLCAQVCPGMHLRWLIRLGVFADRGECFKAPVTLFEVAPLLLAVARSPPKRLAQPRLSSFSSDNEAGLWMFYS